MFKNVVGKIAFLVLLGYSSLFGSDTTGSTDGTGRDIFVKDDKVVDGCPLTCREVKEGYLTQIIGYDWENGTTHCRVVDVNKHDLVSNYKADQTGRGCFDLLANKINAEAEKGIAAHSGKGKMALESTIKYKESPDLTFTRFITALVTLDPTVLNKATVEATGTVSSNTLVDGVKLRGQEASAFPAFRNLQKYTPGDIPEVNANPSSWGSAVMRMIGGQASKVIMATKEAIENGYDFIVGTRKLTIEETQKLSVAEGFNQANMGYFLRLFYAMNQIYHHLQNLLFIVIGGWFVGTIGTQKLIRYIESKGESQGGNQPYLHKFLIPILGVSFFFAPIPEGNNTNDTSTIVQNIIRYFTRTGNDIADMASSIGAKIYIDKMYSSVGGFNINTEGFLRAENARNTFIADQAQNAWNKFCSERFPKDDAFLFAMMNMNGANSASIEIFDFNKQSMQQDITKEACQDLLITRNEARRRATQADLQIRGAEEYINNSSLQKNLELLNRFYEQQDYELGWANSTILPGSAILVELQDYMQSAKVQNTKNGDMVDQAERWRQTTKDATARGITEGSKDSQAIIDYLLSKIVYLMVPGTKSIADALKSMGDGALGAFKNLPFSGLGTQLVAYAAAINIVEGLVKYVPVLVATIAGAIAFIGYITAICKYFYISPFVVAFAITTKRQEKITDFLLAGVSIFFKPVLIVLFIYLSLFLYTLIKEFLLFISIAQFAIIDITTHDASGALVVGGIRAMLSLMGITAGAFVMWKLIIKGPDWVMDLIGIKGGQDSVVADSLTQNLERRAIMVH